MSNFTTNFDHRYWMKSGNLYCGLNTPVAIVSDGIETHGLPPYAKRQGFLVDEYPGCPDNWMRSRGKTTSWFVGVPEGAGMWLDFNKNWEHEYDIAVVISVQGVNPITGMPCTDAHLEQYVEKCPKCDKEFGAERYCEKCGFHWPKQNYISTTSQPYGYFWLDGFRTAEGVVRQYILTEEKLRGVAGHVIGKDRVYAIGISFFLSKERRRQPLVNPRNRTLDIQPQFFSPNHTSVPWDNGCSNWNGSPHLYSCNLSQIEGLSSNATVGACATPYEKDGNATTASVYCRSAMLDGIDMSLSAKSKKGSARLGSISVQQLVKTKKLEVGAGENIDQQVYDDPEPLDFWRDEPESILCINYCLEVDTQKIIDAGRVPIKAEKEGFLQDIPVGNAKQVETA